MFNSHKTSQAIAESLRALSYRLRGLEIQTRYSKPEYIVSHSGFLIQNSLVGATSLTLNTYPQWCVNNKTWVLIDAGTDEAELRRVNFVADTQITFTQALVYAHSQNDSVLFIADARINVLWMGARGDGINDDLTAINRALVQFKTIGEYSTLYLPSGNYKVGGDIRVEASCAIVGEGIGKTFITTETPCVYGIDVYKTYGVKLSKFTIQEGGSGTMGIRFTGVDTYYHENTVEDVAVIGFDNGIFLHIQWGARVYRCYIKDTSICGIRGRYLDHGYIFENVIDGSTGAGIYSHLGETIMIKGNRINDCGSTDTYSAAGSLEGCIVCEETNRAIIQQNSISNSPTGIVTYDSPDMSIAGNVLSSDSYFTAVPIYGNDDRINIYGNVIPDWLSDYNVDIKSKSLGWNNYEGAPQTMRTYAWYGDEYLRSNNMYSEFIPAELFIVTYGSASLVNFGYASDYALAWQMSKTTQNILGAWWRIPRKLMNYSATGFEFSFILYWANLASTTGVVRLGWFGHSGTGATSSTFNFSQSLNIDAYGAAGELFITRCPATWNVHNIDYGLRVGVQRNGANAADTADQDSLFLGMQVVVNVVRDYE